MTDERSIRPWLKSALELGPPVLFFIAYMRFQDATLTIGGTQYDGFIIVTAAFVPLLLASIGVLWWLTRKISRIQVFTAVLVEEREPENQQQLVHAEATAIEVVPENELHRYNNKARGNPRKKKKIIIVKSLIAMVMLIIMEILTRIVNGEYLS